MNTNIVVLNGETLINLSQDTAVESDVALGKTFHKADGSLGVGTHQCEGSGGSAPILEELTATANGEYTPSVDGFSKVTVAVPEVPEWDGSLSKISSDLTNTTWHIPAGWEVDAGYAIFYLNYARIAYLGNEYDCTVLKMGYVVSYTERANSIYCTNVENIGFALSNDTEFTLTITGGNDVGNASLLDWLSKYGKLQ